MKPLGVNTHAESSNMDVSSSSSVTFTLTDCLQEKKIRGVQMFHQSSTLVLLMDGSSSLCSFSTNIVSDETQSEPSMFASCILRRRHPEAILTQFLRKPRLERGCRFVAAPPPSSSILLRPPPSSSSHTNSSIKYVQDIYLFIPSLISSGTPAEIQKLSEVCRV